MPTTPVFGWNTPTLSGPNDVPTDLASLASQIEGDLAVFQSGQIVIGGAPYSASGAWGSETLSGGTLVTTSVYTFALTKTAPFTPPAGWGFAVHVLSSSSYTYAEVGSGGTSSTLSIRVLNVGHSGPTVRLGWRLVRSA